MLITTNSQEHKQSKNHSSTNSSRQLVTLGLGIPIAMLSATRGDYVLAVSLLIALLVTTYEKQVKKFIRKVKVKLKIWQMVVGICIAAVLMGTLQPIAVLAGSPGGQGLFSPLQQQTNNVLTQAGAGAAATSITGIFGLMNR